MKLRVREMTTLVVLLALLAVPVAAGAGACCPAQESSCCDRAGHCPRPSPTDCGPQLAACGGRVLATLPDAVVPAEPVQAPALAMAPVPPGLAPAPAAPRPRARADDPPRPLRPGLDDRTGPFRTLLPPPAAGTEGAGPA